MRASSPSSSSPAPPLQLLQPPSLPPASPLLIPSPKPPHRPILNRRIHTSRAERPTTWTDAVVVVLLAAVTEPTSSKGDKPLTTPSPAVQNGRETGPVNPPAPPYFVSAAAASSPTGVQGSQVCASLQRGRDARECMQKCRLSGWAIRCGVGRGRLGCDVWGAVGAFGLERGFAFGTLKELVGVCAVEIGGVGGNCGISITDDLLKDEKGDEII